MIQLYDFQKECLKEITKLNKCLLALDMGLGKTIVSLYWINNKEKSNWFLIVSKQKLNDWFNTAKDVLDKYYEIKIIKTQKDLDLLFLSNELSKNNQVLIMSYQVFSLYSKKNRLFFLKQNNNTKYSLLLDECQILKNHNSLITKKILEYNTVCSQTILLSGDPISKKYENLYGIMRCLELFPNTYSFFKFVQDYCYFTMLSGTNIRLITGYKNLNTLINLLHTRSYFLKTEKAYDLPNQVFIDINIKENKEQKNLNIHNVLSFNELTFLADTSLKKLNYLRQISSGFLYDDKKNIIKIHENKLIHLKELLDNNKNWIIFYNYEAEKNLITEFLKNEKKIYYICGKIDSFALEKTNIKENDNNILLIQYAAGAVGYDGLQHYFNYTIYFSPPLSGEFYKQSLKRTHRLNQKNKCFYYRFITENSIEKKIYKSLYKSEDYTMSLFENDFCTKNNN